MRTTTPLLAACGLTAMALTAACGGPVNGTGASSSGSKAEGTYAQIAKAPKSKQRAKAQQLAKKEGGTLSLYTSMTSDIVDPIAKAFERDTGVHASVFRANSETVLQRTLQEGKAHKPGADAIETNFLEMTVLARSGYLKEYKGSGLERVEDTARFHGWTADRLNIFQPAWNTKLIKPGQEPHSWEDLADPKYKGKITMEMSDSDWYENVTKYWLDHGKSQAQVDKLWKGIAHNAKVAKGHTTMMQFLTAGQTPMEAMNYTYITDRAAENGAPVSHMPKSGKSKIPAFPRPNGVGMLKDAQHPATAWLFYDWMLREGQKELVKLHLTPASKVPGDDSLKGITLAPFDVKGLSEKNNGWDKKYDALLRGVDTMGK